MIVPLRRSSSDTTSDGSAEVLSQADDIDELRVRTERVHAALLLPEPPIENLSVEFDHIRRDFQMVYGERDTSGPATARPGGGFARTRSEPRGHQRMRSLGYHRPGHHPPDDLQWRRESLRFHLNQVRAVLDDRMSRMQPREEVKGSPPSYAESMASLATDDAGRIIAFGSMSSVWSTSTGETPQHQRDRSTVLSDQDVPPRKSSMRDLLDSLDRSPSSGVGTRMSSSIAPSLPTPTFEPLSLYPWQRDDLFPPPPPPERVPRQSNRSPRPLTLGRRRTGLEIAIPPRRSTGTGMPSARKLLSPDTLGTAKIGQSHMMIPGGRTPS